MTDEQVQTLLMGLAEIGVGLAVVAPLVVFVLWFGLRGVMVIGQALAALDPTQMQDGKPKDRRLRRAVIARALKEERERAWRRRVRRHAARVANARGARP